MGWFGPSGGGAGGPGREAVVTVFASGGAGTSGGAVRLAGRLLLTCAHVVNDALGRPHESVRDPGDALVEVGFAALPGARRLKAGVRHWIPRRAAPRGSYGWLGDLAVLELRDEPPPAARSACWREMTAGQQVVAWYGSGQEYSYAKAEVGSCDGPLGYLDGELAGAAIGPGYSGGPLCLADGTTVGLVMAHIPAQPGPFSAEGVVRRDIGIPWQTVRAELARVGADALWGAGRPGPAAFGDVPADGVRPAARLEQPLAALLADPAIRADRAGQLAERYGLDHPRDGSAPTYQELAELLLHHPRALADMAEIHAPALAGQAQRAALNRLVAAGHGEGLALLSSGEHAELLARLGQLADLDASLLPRAARGALPYARLPAVLRAPRVPAGALGEAVRALECFGGDSAGAPHDTPRVPALLRAVEYLAALGADTGPPPDGCGSALRAWADRVALRLGIPPPALSERRQDAAEWAAGQREVRRPTVVVELDRREEDPEDHYRVALWLTRADGTPERIDHGPERPLPGREIAALVRDTADGCGDGGDPVLVEVWVEADHLHLAVDEWDDAGPADLAAPLGEDHHVVLRCKSGRRKPGALARRWAARTHTEPLVADDRFTDPQAVLVWLKKELDCGRVVVHGPRAHRDAVLRACLTQGVPVVLWDRAAEGYEHAARLDPLRPTGPLGELPERVRRFRIDTYADPARWPARPTLLWEDPGRPLPDGLWLADPEGT